ncbi:MAG TPA: FCD domain-containing protein [Sphaerochaetaceae bacterium]|nr:FCD domain-containing protein [Sphaerochaetaceae bacterium]
MNIAKDKWKKTILEIINEAEDPVGSWYIVNEFTNRGVEVSSATVGRELNQLEVMGYVEKHGFKGRSITSLGRRVIEAANTSLELEQYKKSLDDLINSNVLENFLMVLEARLAIERQTARLAAERIEDDELEELEQCLRNQQSHSRDHQSIANDDICFHSSIAKGSKNKALYSLYMMLSSMGQQSQLFEELRHRVGDNYSNFHERIFHALQSRDPDEAERCMINHISKLINDVKQYWDEYKKHHTSESGRLL